MANSITLRRVSRIDAMGPVTLELVNGSIITFRPGSDSPMDDIGPVGYVGLPSHGGSTIGPAGERIVAVYNRGDHPSQCVLLLYRDVHVHGDGILECRDCPEEFEPDEDEMMKATRPDGTLRFGLVSGWF